MVVLFSIFVAILVLPILLFMIPVHITYIYERNGDKKGQSEVVWLFGLVHFRLKLTRKGDGKDAQWGAVSRKKSVKKKRLSRREKSRNNMKVVLAIVKSEGFVRRVLKLCYDILSVAEIKKLKARVFFGMDDPADTGYAYGLLSPSFTMFYAIPKVDFEAVPVFDRVTIDADIEASIKLVPFSYIKAVMLFVFSTASFRAGKAAFRAYRS